MASQKDTTPTILGLSIIPIDCILDDYDEIYNYDLFYTNKILLFLLSLFAFHFVRSCIFSTYTSSFVMFAFSQA
jgi:hypothetical protein